MILEIINENLLFEKKKKRFGESLHYKTQEQMINE